MSLSARRAWEKKLTQELGHPPIEGELEMGIRAAMGHQDAAARAAMSLKRTDLPLLGRLSAAGVARKKS